MFASMLRVAKLEEEQMQAQAILEKLNSYVEANSLYDCTIVVDGEEFKAMKLWLCACCGFFKEALKEHSRVVINGMKRGTFKGLLQAMTTGKLNVNQQNMIDYWFVAHFLKLDLFSEECEKYIKRKLSTENYLLLFQNIVEMGSQFTLSLLVDLVRSEKNIETFSETELFLNISGDFLKQIINSRSPYISLPYDNLVKSVIKWLKYDRVETHRQYIFEPYTDIKALRDLSVPEEENAYVFNREKIVKSKEVNETNIKAEVVSCLQDALKPATSYIPIELDRDLRKEFEETAKMFSPCLKKQKPT